MSIMDSIKSLQVTLAAKVHAIATGASALVVVSADPLAQAAASLTSSLPTISQYLHAEELRLIGIVVACVNFVSGAAHGISANVSKQAASLQDAVPMIAPARISVAPLDQTNG